MLKIVNHVHVTVVGTKNIGKQDKGNKTMTNITRPVNSRGFSRRTQVTFFGTLHGGLAYGSAGIRESALYVVSHCWTMGNHWSRSYKI